MIKKSSEDQYWYLKLLIQLLIVYLLIYISVEYIISKNNLFYYFGYQVFIPSARFIISLILFFFLSSIIIPLELAFADKKISKKIIKIREFLRIHMNTIIIGATILYILFFYIPLIFNSQSTLIGSVRYWFLGDDAMISMRYAKNFSNGAGLVWNIGENVEGYSNFLWTVIMSLIHFVGVSSHQTSAIILLINGLLFLITLEVLLKIIDSLKLGLLIKLFSSIALMLNVNYLAWSKSGFETSLLALVILIAIYVILGDIKSGKPRLLTFFIISLISLIRADGIIFTLLLFVIYLFSGLPKLKIFKYSLISLTLPVFHLIFRLFYYNDVLPNTAYLKVSGFENRVLIGAEYFLSFLGQYVLFFILLFFLIMFTKDKLLRLMALFILIYNLYVIFIGGDAFENFRFYVPLLPLIFLLGYSTLEKMFFNPIFRTALSLIILFSSPLLFPKIDEIWSPQRADIGNLKIGLLIEQNTPHQTKVADFWAGTVFYYSDRYGVDLLGKTDKHVARLPATSDGLIPGHNKFDFEYSLNTYKPDLVIANFILPVDSVAMAGKASGDYAFTGELYFSDTFQKEYYPNPIDLNTFRTIFRANESLAFKNIEKEWLDKE